MMKGYRDVCSFCNKKYDLTSSVTFNTHDLTASVTSELDVNVNDSVQEVSCSVSGVIKTIGKLKGIRLFFQIILLDIP